MRDSIWTHSFSRFIVICHYSSQISITSPVIWIHSDFYFNSYQKHSFSTRICKFSDWIFYRTRGLSISEMISDLRQFYRICRIGLQARNFVISIWWSFLWNSFKIWLQITKLWARHNLLQNLLLWPWPSREQLKFACNTSSQYGDHFCEIVLKSDLK